MRPSRAVVLKCWTAYPLKPVRVMPGVIIEATIKALICPSPRVVRGKTSQKKPVRRQDLFSHGDGAYVTIIAVLAASFRSSQFVTLTAGIRNADSLQPMNGRSFARTLDRHRSSLRPSVARNVDSGDGSIPGQGDSTSGIAEPSDSRPPITM